MRMMNTHEYEVKLFKSAERSMRYHAMPMPR